jgi:hypothetical protein
MKSTIDMAREAWEQSGEGWVHPDWFEDRAKALKAFEALVRADEREACAKRRGVLAFCPYTGRPRHPSDIASDPHGILILVPDQPLQAEKKDNNA